MFIIGESGSGKTTLLNLIVLLDKPDKGELVVDSKCINKFKQKEIGILRALGAKTSDIYKIFYLEIFIVGLFAFVISNVISYFSVLIVNNIISSNLFIHIKPVMFRVDTIYILFIVLMYLTIISFVIPLLKISKMKPIDLISSK